MMKVANKVGLFLSVLGATAFLFIMSCASPAKPASAEPEKKKAPDWVLTPPQGNAQNEFFVGSASDASGDAAKAEEQAVYSLIAEITRYLGVKVTAETTSQAKASLDNFQAQITQQVKQSGNARLAGFRVADRFQDQQGGRVTVYLLAQYERTELQKEKDRIAAVFQEQVDAVAVPEKKGKDLEGRGDLFGALKAYLEAATAASGSNIDNAAIKFERNINNAKAALGKISLVSLSPGLKAKVGEAFAEPFRFKVVNGQAEKDPPVKAADVQVTYKEGRAGGRLAVKTVNLQSNDQGVVEFVHPAPTFVGSETVTVMLDLSAFLAPLAKLPKNFANLVAGLEDLANTKRVNVEYSVASRAKDVALGIVVLDTDSAGNPTGNSNTAAGALEALSADGFKVRTLAFNATKLKTLSDAEVVKNVSASFGGQIERVIFGVIAVDEFEQEKGSVQVRVAGTLKALDLKSGQTLYTKRLIKRSVGSTAEAAMNSAFRNLGLDFGKDLSRNLP